MNVFSLVEGTPITPTRTRNPLSMSNGFLGRLFRPPSISYEVFVFMRAAFCMTS